MKLLYSILIAGFLILSASFTHLPATEWTVMDNYSVAFSSKRVKGSFSGLTASIRFEENDLPASKISATIDPATISTGIRLKNKHARSQKALNTTQYPVIRFESTQILKTASGYEAIGKLTLREVSQEIRLPFTFERTGAASAVFKGRFQLRPKEYQVTRNGTPETVSVELVVPVKK
jgi:polyisoprenoid-binding protein YceI